MSPKPRKMPAKPRPLRVVLIGAESTGKTTLARALAEHYGVEWVREYAREHWDAKVATHKPGDPDPYWSEQDLVDIATEQLRREDAGAARARRLVIGDTSAFATGTWYERYHGRRSPRIDAIGRRSRADLYLLTSPDIPFIQDGVRDGERIRHWMHDRFLEQLIRTRRRYVALYGSPEYRMTDATAAIDAVLKGVTRVRSGVGRRP